jgi:type VI secretion system VasD/TssJ family lipoprotein
MQGAHAVRKTWRGLAVALLLAAGGCFGASDPDLAQPEEAEVLALGTPLMNRLECDEGEGDCNDWYRLDVPEAGSLEVVVASVAGQGSAAQLAVTLADGGQLTLVETPSGGRPRFGVRWEVTPGVYFVWIRADGSTKGELGYQVSASVAVGAPAAGGTAITDPSSPRLCLRVEASPRLNYFSGQPHVVRLVLYPLESSLAFEQADEDALLRGTQPAGVVGAAIQLKVVPGETRALADPLPPNVRAIGVVADFYRPPGSREGRRKATLPSSCARGEVSLALGESEIELE